MRQKGFSPVIILVIISIGIGLFYLVRYVNNWVPDCVYDPKIAESATPKPFEANNEDLVFLTTEDKQKIYDAIDSAHDPKDLDFKLFSSLVEVLEPYEEKGVIKYASAKVPEFLSEDPRSITITSSGCKTDLLEGIELSSIKGSDMPTLKAFAKLFIEETSKYPLAWWEQALPPFVVFVKTVKVQGEIVGGVEVGAVVYDITSIDINKEETREIIHHELMHWLEHTTLTENDPSWPAGKEAYTQTYNLSASDSNFEHPEIGFVTNYAKTNSFEDKAEIYSYLFTDDGYRKLNTWSKADAEVSKKVQYIKNFIRLRVGRMDDKYFETYILN